MGLLQASLVATCIRPALRSYLLAGQSGYSRGTEDAHLVLFDTAASARQSNRCLWLLMGDYEKSLSVYLEG